jgi:hypothetical protein
MAGFQKVRRCCEQAIQDGFEWAWVDTCCIDKRSSAELTEAINSMWKYYWQAAICYAYLSDVPESASMDKDSILERFKRSRWFTRGWTLQELLAPAVVEFYDSSWTILGTKSSLLDIIAIVTRIDELSLRTRTKIKKASVAQKFSWAANRETSREEDMAYCLLGLLNVHMPLLYGEGKRAFQRLQLELMTQSNEHTLFAWEAPGADMLSVGVLCSGPLGFLNSGGVRRTATMSEAPSFAMTNKGLIMNLPCIKHPTHPTQIIALLNCYFDDPANQRSGRVGILLDGSVRYWRVARHPLEAVGYLDTQKAENRELCLITGVGEVALDPQWQQSQYGVAISLMPSIETRFQIIHLAKYCPRFQGGMYVGMDGPVQITTSEYSTFEPDDFAGILFLDSVSNLTFLVAFGQRSYSMLWLHVEPGVVREQCENVMKMARMETITNSDLLRDAVDVGLGDGSTVSVRAKKRRHLGVVGWQVLIHVAEAGVVRTNTLDSDTTMVSVDEAEAEDESVAITV